MGPGDGPAADLERHGRVDELAAEWDELADDSRAPPWLRPGWIAAWWRAFGQGRLEILSMRRNGRLVAVLPLERRAGQLRSTSNVHTPVYGLLAADDLARRELAAALFRNRPSRIALLFVAPDGMGLAECRNAARAARCLARTRTLERSPYVPVDTDWAAYEGRLDPHLLREVRRRQRQLGRHGRIELSVEEGHERLDALLAEGYHVEAAGWKGSRGTAISSRSPTRRFYTEVATWARDRGWLRLAFLRLDGRALAFDYAVEADGVHYLLKTGFDPQFRRSAPGILLREAMIRRAFNLGLRSYEFLGADEPWKRPWASTQRPRLSFQAFAPTPVGLFQWVAIGYAMPVVRRIVARVVR